MSRKETAEASRISATSCGLGMRNSRSHEEAKRVTRTQQHHTNQAAITLPSLPLLSHQCFSSQAWNPMALEAAGFVGFGQASESNFSPPSRLPPAQKPPKAPTLGDAKVPVVVESSTVSVYQNGCNESPDSNTRILNEWISRSCGGSHYYCHPCNGPPRPYAAPTAPPHIPISRTRTS